MTRTQVKKTALRMAKKIGLINLTRRNLCEELGIPDGSWLKVMDCTFSDLMQELQKESKSVNNHPVNRGRVEANLRHKQILEAAIKIALKVGYHKMTRGDIALKAGISMGLITLRFGTMVKLRRAVMRAAIAQEIPEIVAQGLANSDPHARKAPPTLKAKAATLLSTF